MKKETIIELLEMMGVNYQSYDNYIYVESVEDDDEAMWKIDFINGIGYNADTKEIVDYKLLANIKASNFVS